MKSGAGLKPEDGKTETWNPSFTICEGEVKMDGIHQESQTTRKAKGG